ncbi:MAG: putative AAA+ superfamily ATPase [Chlamydiales bacterium]|jgi:predicted AAA+ superfamily ATPase
MKRLIDDELDKWKTSPYRKPLIIRGARQVGKSFSVESFGERAFENVVTLNFELHQDLEKWFKTLDPPEIKKSNGKNWNDS